MSRLDIELEVFIHGAMCASYSGKCVISNYSSGRDSNRGGCVQSCRHTYELHDKKTGDLTESANIMNAKDLQAIKQIPKLIESGIHSLKIEGRMKSNFYVANTVRTYRKAIDEYLTNETVDFDTLCQELNRPSNRQFSSGGLESRPEADSIHYQFKGYEKSNEFIGTVKYASTEEIFIQVKQPPNFGDKLSFMGPKGSIGSFQLTECKNMAGEKLEKIHPSSMIRIPKNISYKAKPLDIVFR